jgi:adenylate kinase family enzyme
VEKNTTFSLQRYNMFDFIFIAGAPGSGKTTVSRLLQEKLQSPAIDFGYIREFHLDREWKKASDKEEQMSFENLVFILKNYAKHGYTNVIVTDLLDFRIEQIPEIFKDYRYIIISLVVNSDEELKKRVLTESRDSGFRDFEKALAWNKGIQERNPLLGEHKVDNTHKDPLQTVSQVISLLQM